MTAEERGRRAVLLGCYGGFALLAAAVQGKRSAGAGQMARGGCLMQMNR